ncbi:unnamed protein product [Miscanthus lutarioriparius]|uniref:Uncharacterized protein n=1 Tax=Miscanthus lutarioriparius TaxID=422564 RepID=A0A811S9Q8_9POAL|nr:unnamed protein product [Miscanthus lutarioriparius]
MASGGGYYSPYYQPAAPYYYNYNYPQQRVRGGGGQSSSVYAFILLVTVSFITATTLYTWCESAMESLVDQLRRLLILSPLIVIIAVQLWVATGGGGDGVMSLLAEMVTGDKYGCAGGAGSSSPWGVALALVLVLFLVSLFGQTGDRYGAGGAAGSSSLWGVALVLVLFLVSLFGR